jgi:hypothetical protein
MWSIEAERVVPMNRTKLKCLGAVILLAVLALDVRAKEWRGIIPLRSTKSEVERLLGKPNQLGRYDIENERVSILYSDGPCDRPYQALAKANCECLVAKDTVLRIFVTLDSPVSVARLALDKTRYERTRIDAYRPTATYSDLTEGVVYTVRESDDVVTNIDYLPSAKECEEIIKSQAPAAAPNVWHGIVPLRSTRSDVEKILGPHKTSHGDVYIYDAAEHRVDVSYSADPCTLAESRQTGAAFDVVSKVQVSPRKTLLIQNLGLDKDKYKRIQETHPENWIHYLNPGEGITVNAMVNNECEEVISIVYEATTMDRQLRCGVKQKVYVKRP